MANCPVLKAIRAELSAAAPFQVRRATVSDIAALMDFKRLMAAADGVETMFNAGPGDWARDGVGPGARFVTLVAECSGSIVGMAIFSEQVFAGMLSPSIYLQDLYVRADHRGRGIARALLARVAAESQARAAQLLYLTVSADNPARQIYEHLGFVHSPTCEVYALSAPGMDVLGGAAASRPRG